MNERNVWTNQSSVADAPCTLEGLADTLASLPDPHTILDYFEVPDTSMAIWLTELLHTHRPIRCPSLLSLPPIRINERLAAHSFLARNRFDEPLYLFIRKENGKLLQLDMRRATRLDYRPLPNEADS